MPTNPYNNKIPGQKEDLVSDLNSIRLEMSTNETNNEAAHLEMSTRIDDEEYNRIAAVTAEAAARVSADQVIDGKITTEVSDRQTADSALQTQITTNTNNLATEVTNRGNADTTLQNNINTEASTRSSADSALSTRSTNLETFQDTITNKYNIIPDYQETGVSYVAYQSVVIYNKKVYKSNTSITAPAGVFDTSKWTAVGGGAIKPYVGDSYYDVDDIVYYNISNVNEKRLYRMSYSSAIFSSNFESELSQGKWEQLYRKTTKSVTNLIQNGTFETNIQNWYVYKDAAAAIPVDGTGGSPSYVQINHVYGDKSVIDTGYMMITKYGSNAQGEGVNCVFEVPPALRGTNLELSFYCITGISGNTEDYASGDFGIFVYDMTNRCLIPTSVSAIPAGNSKFTTVLTCPSTCANMRVIFHCTTTKAGLGYTLGIGRVVMTEFKTNNVSASGYYRSYTPAVTAYGVAITNVSATADYWRENNQIKVKGCITFTGTPGNFTGLHVSIPSGLTFASSVGHGYQLGYATIENWSSSTAISAIYPSNAIWYYSPLPNYAMIDVSFISSPRILTGAIDPNSPFTFGQYDKIFFEFSAPIAQWDSPITLVQNYTEYASNDGSTVTAGATNNYTHSKYGMDGSFLIAVNSTTSNSATHFECDFKNDILDTDTLLLEWFDPIIGWLQVPNLVSRMFRLGDYYYGMEVLRSASSKKRVMVNMGNGGVFPSGTTFNTAGTAWSGFTSYKWRVRKSSGQNVAEKTPKVSVEYKSYSGQAITNSTWTTINYDTKIYDSHSCVTTGSGWKFTSPITDTFTISAKGMFAYNSWTVGTFIDTKITVTTLLGVTKEYIISRTQAENANTDYKFFGGTISLPINAGDTVCIKVNHNRGSTSNLHNDANYNCTWITITN